MTSPQDPASALEPASAHTCHRIDDEPERCKLTLGHSALSHAVGSHGAAAMATVRLDRATLAGIVGGGGFAAALQQGRIPVDGDALALCRRPGTLDAFNPMFNILER